MLKTHICIFLSYVLVVTTGCKRKSERASQLADLPTQESAYSQHFSKSMKDDQRVIKNFMTLFKENGFGENVSFIKINEKTRDIKVPTLAQVYGDAPLEPGYELFIGKPMERYAVGIEVTARNQEHVTFSVLKYDISALSKGVIQKVNWVSFSLSMFAKREDLSKEIGSQMRMFKSFFQDPNLISLLGDARRQVKGINKKIDRTITTFEEDRDHSIGGTTAAFLTALVFLGVTLFQTFFTYKVPFSDLVKTVRNFKGATHMLKATVIIIAVCFVFLLVAVGVMTGTYYYYRDKKPDVSGLKSELANIVKKYGEVLYSKDAWPDAHQ